MERLLDNTVNILSLSKGIVLEIAQFKIHIYPKESGAARIGEGIPANFQ